jgi:biopolymer transport protein ExbD
MSPDSKKRIKAAPFTLWLIPGFVISIGLFCLSVLLIAVIPWGIFGGGGPGPPERIDPPLFSGLQGLFVVIITVGSTGVGIWFDRGQEKRIDPIARIAACLAVLGIAEAISVATIMASGNVWPVNLIDVILWLLSASIAVGVISWIRLLLAGGELRGWIFATCSVACSACALWHVDTGLVNFYKPLPDDGIELPVVFHSRQDKPNSEEYRPELNIGIDVVEELPDFGEIAARMKKKSWTSTYGPSIDIPDEPVLIRADARASWASVRDIIAKVGEAKIWKVQIAARWEDPPTQTRLYFYLPSRVNVEVPDAEPGSPPYRLKLQADGHCSLDEESFATLEALIDHLNRMKPERKRRESRTLWIDPDDSTPWQEVLAVVESWYSRHGHEFQLGPLLLMVE